MKTLTLADYAKAAKLLRTGVAEIKAVKEVESSGKGFLADGRLVIRFEGHWFRKYTGRRYDATHPTISHPYFSDGRYNKGVSSDYNRLKIAMSLDAEAAMKSTSWGMFQVMGFNHKLAGYATVHAMVDDYKTGEPAQLLSFCKLIQAKQIDDELRDHEWAGFAYIYNGADYAAGRYDKKLQAAYERNIVS